MTVTYKTQQATESKVMKNLKSIVKIKMKSKMRKKRKKRNSKKKNIQFKTYLLTRGTVFPNSMKMWKT